MYSLCTWQSYIFKPQIPLIPSLILFYHLVLKFANKRFFFFRKSRIRIFLEKGGYFGTHLCKIGEKGLILMSSVLPWNRSSFGLKSQSFTTKKWVLGLKSQCFIAKRGRFELKSQCFATKKRVIFKLENKDGYHFFQWVRELGKYHNIIQIF